MKPLYIAYLKAKNKPLKKIVGIYKDPSKMRADLAYIAKPFIEELNNEAYLEFEEIYTDLFDPISIK